MAVVHITMNTRRSPAGVLLPQDVELNILALELFYYACAALLQEGDNYPLADIGTDVVVDQIGLSNPFDIWAFLKSIPAGVAREVLDRTVFYRAELDRRDAETGKLRQGVVSDKLDNLRKANEVRKELIASGGDPDDVTRQLAEILRDQSATIDVYDGDQRRKAPPRLLF